MHEYTSLTLPRKGIFRLGAYRVAIYLFFITLALQNAIALIVVGAGMNIPLTRIFLVKDALLAALCAMLVTTKASYKFGRADQMALLIVAVVLMAVIAKGGGVYDMAMQLRFYLVPILLFLVGRNTAPFYKQKDIYRFLMTIGAAYVILGIAFTVIDRDLLLQMGIGHLLDEKLGYFGRGEQMNGGFPINFYFYHSNGDTTERAFGMLFDPLASAYFGAVLFFHLLEVRKRSDRSAVAGILAAGVALMIMLSITRAIIIGVIFCLILFRIGNTKLRMAPLVLSFSVISIVIIIVAMGADSSIGLVDPSTLAHLSAYKKIDLYTLIVGGGIIPGQPRGAESLYLTIAKEYGISLLFLYAIWLVVLYRWYRANFKYPYAYATTAAMVVYAVASLTTEHWFSISSSALFWFLLGNNMTAIERMSGAVAPANQLQTVVP